MLSDKCLAALQLKAASVLPPANPVTECELASLDQAESFISRSKGQLSSRNRNLGLLRCLHSWPTSEWEMFTASSAGKAIAWHLLCDDNQVKLSF